MKYQLHKNKLIYLFLFLTACSSTSESPEALSLMEMQMQMQMQTQMRALEKQLQNVGNKKSLPKLIISENEQKILDKMQAIPKLETAVNFIHNKEGSFLVNGEIFIDSDGEIEDYIFNSHTGDVYYLIKNYEDPTKYTIKYTRVLTSTNPITIARIIQSGSYQISISSGSEIIADKIKLTSNGFAALKSGTIYHYKTGYGVTSSYLPKGWHIAKYQNSKGTNYILLEKDKVKSSLYGSDLGELISAVGDLGNTLGINNIQDYMLINIFDNSKHKIFNITLGNKEVQKLTNCQASKHKYMIKCLNMDTKNSPFQYNGEKNIMHYYWRIFWFDTNVGTLAVSLEKTNTQVRVTNLNTGKEFQIASNLMGFPSIDMFFNNDNTIDVMANGNLQILGESLVGGEVTKDITSLFKQ